MGGIVCGDRFFWVSTFVDVFKELFVMPLSLDGVLADRGVDVDYVFSEMRDLCADFRDVRVRRPRKWKGEALPERWVPIAVANVSCFEFRELRSVLSDLAAVNHISVSVDRGYRNSRSDIMVFVNLKKWEFALLSD